MKDISSEAKKAGLAGPEKPIGEMTEDELMAFRASFDPDMMGFDGTEGIDGLEDPDEEEGSDDNGSC